MQIVVCLKQVVTREWQVRIDAARPWVRDADASFELNEPDAYALEEALRLKDAHGGQVIAVSAGPSRVTQVLREALARGADRAVHVAGEHLASADARTTASALASALQREAVDLVLTGLQSDDQGFGQVGVVLAELLGLPHASLVVTIDATEAGRLRVKRELEGGWFQWMGLPLPALLTVQSGINQLRYATLKGIMAAKKKELNVVDAPAPPAGGLRIVALQVPTRAKQTRMLGGSATEAATALVQALRETGSLS